jgi:hypothetical protein
MIIEIFIPDRFIHLLKTKENNKSINTRERETKKNKQFTVMLCFSSS